MAVQFADLHDTPGRMLEKGVIEVSYHKAMLIIILMNVCYSNRIFWTGKHPENFSIGG